MVPAARSQRLALSAVLRALADDTSRDRIAFGDLLAAFADRALAALMFVFAIPNVLPSPPGLSTVLGAPLVLLAAQVGLGLNPWLPQFIGQRSLAREDFQRLVDRVVPRLARAEKLLKPRFSWLAMPPMENLVGLFCFMLALILALPIPMGNNLPALAISLVALGLLERDGLWVSAGILTGVVAMVVVSGVLYALVQAALLVVMQWLP